MNILISDAVGLLLLIWVLNLIRRDRLYVGYGAALVVCLAALLIVFTVPGLMTRAVVSAFRLMAPLTWLQLCLYLLLFLLIYVLNQLTMISNRVVTIIQELAILRAREGKSRAA